jgi:tRNA(Ile)-lysidine synthase
VQLAATQPDLSDLDAVAAEVLDRRLSRVSARPVAVALSGGGDSVALLLAAHAWARRAGRPLLALTVDHGLQAQSAAWTAACAARAQALGVGFRALGWDGEKPAHGLPAAAREARHALLADAARAAGAAVILIGHTADDSLEARAMRRAGSSTPEPRDWTPSPAWPQGRGLFLLRPLLGVRRAEIRRWLEALGETWIEDPVNLDPRYARARARRDLAGAGPTAPEPHLSLPRDLAAACRMDGAGVLSLDRARLRTAPETAATFIAMAALCAAGARRPPERARAERLAERLCAEGDVAATLAGARIEADAGEVRFLREPGEAARGGLAPLVLAAGETGVWDGRFEITAEGPLEVRALAGMASGLGKVERASLKAYPAKARAGLPADATPRLLAQARPLALARLHAACGLIECEPD